MAVLSAVACAGGAPEESPSPGVEATPQVSSSPSASARPTPTATPTPSTTVAPTGADEIALCPGVGDEPSRIVRELEHGDIADVEAAFGFAIPAAPSCGFVDETGDLERVSRTVYLEFGDDPEAFDALAQQFEEDGWTALGSGGPPVFERDGVQVALTPTPAGVFVALP